jgi:peroxiredoxin Q/BCP
LGVSRDNRLPIEKSGAKMLKIGDKAPDFRLQTDVGGEMSLGGLKGRRALLFFFPKADTPG